MSKVLINSRKYDGTIHRSWEAGLVRQVGPMLVFEGVFETEIWHKEIGIIRPGTISLEYYWLDRNYNVFRFLEPEGDPKCLYCNVNLPPVLDNGILDYVDLDLDILAFPGREPVLLDEEEFIVNAETYGYPEDLVSTARKAVQDVLGMLGRGDAPFHF